MLTDFKHRRSFKQFIFKSVVTFYHCKCVGSPSSRTCRNKHDSYEIKFKHLFTANFNPIDAYGKFFLTI